ncbi:MAG: hypothetical protein GY839_08810 [candidate division Zixibacteria bacterium]|nr:hypothetical protein [candidate division Zixibacteria bacterium]
MVLISLSISLLAPSARAVKIEFGLGLAMDAAIDEPLPDLNSGFGYAANANLIFKRPIGFTLGAIGTGHEFLGDRTSTRQIQSDSRRNLFYLQANYYLLRQAKHEISASVGLTFNSISGGDQTGVRGTDSLYNYLELGFDTKEIGYSGMGYWFGINAKRLIQKPYYLIFGFRYNLLSYSKRQSIIQDEQDEDILYAIEYDTNRDASSFIFFLGVSFRLDLSRI